VGRKHQEACKECGPQDAELNVPTVMAWPGEQALQRIIVEGEEILASSVPADGKWQGDGGNLGALRDKCRWRSSS